MAKISRVKIYIILAIVIVIFFPLLAKYTAFKYKDRKLDERIEALKAKNKRLEKEKRSLETDILYVEKKAREKMGVVRKGEVVIKESPKQ